MPASPDFASVAQASGGDGALPSLADAPTRARHLVPRLQTLAADDDRTGAFPAASFDLLRRAGLLTAPLPPDQGSEGLGSAPNMLGRLLRTLAQIGRGSLPVGRLYEGHVNALLLIDTHGSEAQRQACARDAAAGRLFGVWNTGEVRLERTASGVRMRGAQVFCSGAGDVDRPLVNGPLEDEGWQMALVPMERVGARVVDGSWRAQGMRASRSGKVDFEGVELPVDALVGAPDAYHGEPDFNGGAIRFAAVQLGGAHALVDACRSYLTHLDRTGDAHQRERMGRMAIGLETGYLWLGGAARLLESDAPTADQVAYVQMARTAVERVCLDVLEMVDRSVGARGLLPPSPVERIGRDLRLYLRQPASDAVVTAAGAHAFGRVDRALGSDLTAAPR